MLSLVVVSADSLSVSAPRPPELPPPHRIPLVATLAPLAVSLALFAVTRSPFTLVFAVLGPVVAIASMVDAALQRRRTARGEALRFAADAASVSTQIAALHERERGADAAQGLTELLAHPNMILERWLAESAASVRLGIGARRSELRYEGPGTTLPASPSVQETLDELRERAAWLESAPVSVAAGTSVAVVGPTALREAALRSLVVNLATTLSPASWSLAGGGPHTEWIRRLPHATLSSGVEREIRFARGNEQVRLVGAATRADVPADFDVVLTIDTAGHAHRDGQTLQLDLVSAQEAVGAAVALARLAERAGLRSEACDTLVESVTLGELGGVRPSGSDLSAAVGMSATGPLVLDLVADGPHAIVGGMTGSGKSEFLLSWVLGMASPRPPSEVTFLFVDFKGGASFGALRELPHCLGIITDLDTAQALRALESLAAELRRRERLLASHDLRGVDEAFPPPFPRLVVMVDEYAALVETLPALHQLFLDIAARGRSLGVHLVLCTQRPAGVIRDGILANCALRISLRVTGGADSAAVLGTDAAARLPVRPAGRALVSAGGAEPVPFQVALSSTDDCRAVAGAWSAAPRPPAPWLPPLPAVVRMEDVSRADNVAKDEIPFALIDLPSQQAQPVARYRPAQQGSLLVLGAANSGKTGVLDALAAAPSGFDIRRLAGDIPELWDVVTEALAGEPSRTAAPRLVMIDDLDVVLARCDEAYRIPLIEALARLLREGTSRGIWLVVTAQRLGGGAQVLVALCGPPLLLRMSSRAEHALAGGAGSDYDLALPPGAGYWLGNRVQIARADRPSPTISSPRVRVLDPSSSPLAVVSTRPLEFAERLSTAAPGRAVVLLGAATHGEPSTALEVTVGDVPAIVVGDPDLWQAHWSLLGSLQRGADVLFDGCSLAELRALTRSRELPPPCEPGVRPLWVRSPDGDLARARIDTQASAASSD